MSRVVAVDVLARRSDAEVRFLQKLHWHMEPRAQSRWDARTIWYKFDRRCEDLHPFVLSMLRVRDGERVALECAGQHAGFVYSYMDPNLAVPDTVELVDRYGIRLARLKKYPQNKTTLVIHCHHTDFVTLPLEAFPPRGDDGDGDGCPCLNCRYANPPAKRRRLNALRGMGAGHQPLV